MKETPGCSKKAVIIGTGSYLPEKILTNADLEKIVDTTDEWITVRTGIKERHIARDDQAASDLGAEAARKAIKDAGIQPGDIDMILAVSITSDMLFPSVACLVQQKIGAENAFCFDLQAACAGFVYGLEVARQFIATGSVKTILLVGAEKMSSFTDWHDRTTCVLFGDGAGAVVLQSRDSGHGILAAVMGSDGRLSELLNVPAGGSRLPASAETVEKRLHCIRMVGKDVFKHAVRCMADACREALSRSGLTIDDIRMVIPHQANMRIINAIADNLGVSLEKFQINLEKVGNMSSASIPVALDEALADGKIKKGDKILMVAFGGGFTWGAAILEWEK